MRTLWVAAYVASIVVANWATSVFGLVPIGFGLAVTAHDPMCPYDATDLAGKWASLCLCTLLARVREDERGKARIEWEMSNGPAFDFARGGNWRGDMTHCEKGHPLSGGNLRVDPQHVQEIGTGTKRVCRTCDNERHRAARARKKEAS